MRQIFIPSLIRFFTETGKPRPPLMLSVTITDNSGRNLSGQMVEAFYTSLEHCKPFSVGINCALGPASFLQKQKVKCISGSLVGYARRVSDKTV